MRRSRVEGQKSKVEGEKVKRGKREKSKKGHTILRGRRASALGHPTATRHPLPAFWLIALGFLLPAFCFPPALAQDLQTRLELRFTTALAVNSAFPPSALWGLGAHLEARYTLEPFGLNLVLDPGVNFAQPVITDAGLTEAYGLYRQGELDLSLGIERLPLETARLSLPYSLEPLSPLGNRQGRLGARVSWNPEAARVRLALLEDSGQVMPVLSLRREFGDFEMEAHGIYRNDRVIIGLGGSGTLADLVLYGEVWMLGWPPDWHYALGLSGAWGDGIWTLEGGRAAPSALEPVRPLLAGQLSLPEGEEASWNVLGKLLFGDALRLQAGIGYTLAIDDAQLESTLIAQIGPEPFSLRLVLGLKAFPDLLGIPR